MGRNGNFSYSDGSFDVYVISFSYSWRLESRSSSQARVRQTMYPFRAVPSDINVVLQFRDREEMQDFAHFARKYHMKVSKKTGKVGDGEPVPGMKFSLKVSSYDTKSMTVALPSVPVVHTNDSVAPTMRLRLPILYWNTKIISFVKSYSEAISTGTMSDVLASSNRVYSDDVDVDGDDAYYYSTSDYWGTATKNGQGLKQGGH